MEGCVVVCAAGAGALDGVAAVALMALGFAVAAALVVAVVSVVLGYAWVLTLAMAVACVTASWAFVRVWKFGPTLEVFRRHRRVRHVPALQAARAPAALPRGTQLALEAPKRAVIPGVVENVYEEAVR